MIFVKYCRPILRSLFFHTAFLVVIYIIKKEASSEKKDQKR